MCTCCGTVTKHRRLLQLLRAATASLPSPAEAPAQTLHQLADDGAEQLVHGGGHARHRLLALSKAGGAEARGERRRGRRLARQQQRREARRRHQPVLRQLALHLLRLRGGRQRLLLRLIRVWALLCQLLLRLEGAAGQRRDRLCQPLRQAGARLQCRRERPLGRQPLQELQRVVWVRQDVGLQTSDMKE